MSHPRARLPRVRGLLLQARWLVSGEGRVLRDGGLWIANGRIARVLASPAELRSCRRRTGATFRDLGASLLAPGFVDAHAHLELGALRGKVLPGRNFREWIGALLRERSACSGEALRAGARAGADELLASGTTLVADIDSLGIAGAALRDHPLRRIPFHELLDARDPARSSGALERVRAALGETARLGHGFSPHAPATVSAGLAASIARLSSRRRARVMIHWAETAEEELWLERGEGPLAALLRESPRARGLALLEAARLVGPRTLLVHGNEARPAERERVVRAGAALVHCPGTHAFFGRARFPFGAWSAAGARLALGTDSLASNRALDMRAEIAQLLRAQPGLAPRTAWLAGTRGGAEALGLSGRTGELVAGAFADFLVLDGSCSSAASVWEPLCSPEAPIREVWIAGQPVISGSPIDGNAPPGLNFPRASPE